jgi:lysophospholipase L1-like esterase
MQVARSPTLNLKANRVLIMPIKITRLLIALLTTLVVAACAPSNHSPTAAVEQQPVTPINQQPAAPVEPQPVAPINQQPTAPVEPQPVAPINQQPLPPATDNKKAGFNAIMIGDSLAAGGWGFGGTVVSTPGLGFVVSGNPESPIATITTSTQHALITGNYVQVFNSGDSTFADAINGAVVRVLSTPSPTQFTVNASFANKAMPLGDYSAGYQRQPWQVRSMFQVTDQSWLQWLNQYMKGRFIFVANYSIGGTTSSVGTMLIPKIKAGPKADYAFIQYCTNDVNAYAMPHVDECLSNIQQIVAAVIELGMTPVLSTPPAIGDTAAQPNDPASGVKAAALRAIRDGMSQLAKTDSRIIFLDTLSESVDPSDSVGRFLNQYAPIDGIHLSSFGSAAIAKHFAQLLSASIPIIDTLPTEIDDDMTINPGSSNIIQNGMMVGTGGSIASTSINTVTGTIATGWSAQSLGGSTLAPTVIELTGGVTHSDMFGHALDVHVLSATTDQGFQIGSNGLGGSSFAQRMQVDHWYQCGFQITARTTVQKLNVSGQIFLNFGLGMNPSSYFMSSTNLRYENGIHLEPDEQLTLTSQPFYLPAIPNSAYLFINTQFRDRIRDQRFSIGRAFCRVVENPYR